MTAIGSSAPFSAPLSFVARLRHVLSVRRDPSGNILFFSENFALKCNSDVLFRV